MQSSKKLPKGQLNYPISTSEITDFSDVSYTTPIDTDSLLIKDVTNSLWKRLTWANLKSNLDSVYLRYNQASHFVINDTTDSSAVTGTTAETIAKSYTIPANSFTHSYVPKLFLYAQKTNQNGAFTIREYMSNTNNFATAINTAFYTTAGGTIRGVPIERMFRKFVGTNLYTQMSVQSLLTDNTVTSNGGTTFAINQANTIYVWYTIQNASAADSTVITMVNLID